MNSNTSHAAAPRWRSSAIALLIAVAFFATWHFLPGRAMSGIQAPDGAAQPSILGPQPATPTVASSTTPVTPDVMPLVPSAAAIKNTVTAPQADILEPSKGSLLPHPKPRNVERNDRALYELSPVVQHLTARTVGEARWMDLQDFPTREEIETIDPESLDNYRKKGQYNLRAISIMAAIYYQRNDERWKWMAGILSEWGSPFGTRLKMADLMRQPFSLARDRSIMKTALRGWMLGDRYFPAYLSTDARKVWTTFDVANTLQAVTYEVQVRVPASRARAGLPPLIVVPITPDNWPGERN
jgi:hypothetical protein